MSQVIDSLKKDSDDLILSDIDTDIKQWIEDGLSIMRKLDTVNDSSRVNDMQNLIINGLGGLAL